MSGIPTVPGSEIDLRTPERAVHLDAAAINKPRMRGAMATAGALDSVADVAEGIGHDIQRAKNAGIAADVDLKMRTARQTFLESLRNDPDESKWSERAQETSDHVRDDIFSTHENIPPGMRQQVESAFKSWQSGLLVETKTLSNVQSVNRAWSKNKEDYQESLKDGQGQHAMAVLENSRRAQLADPVEIDEMERAIPKGIARNYIQNGLMANPKQTLDLLKSGGSLPAEDQNGKPIVPRKVFSPKEMEQLQNTARIQTAAWQKTNGENMLKEDADPVTGFVPEETIKSEMKQGNVSEAFGRALISAQDRKLKAQQADESRVLAAQDREAYNMVSAKAHDSTAWGVDPDVYAHKLVEDAADITNPSLRQRAINDVNHQLAAVKKTGETAERPIERQMNALINDDKESIGAMVPIAVEDVPAGESSGQAKFGLGIFTGGVTSGSPASTRYTRVPGGLKAINKMTDDEVKATFGEKASKDDVVSAVNRHAAQLQNEMREWFQSPEGLKATWEQADAHRQKLERPWVMDSVRNSLSTKPPVDVSTEEEFNSLPSGAPFVWNGRPGTKK